MHLKSEHFKTGYTSKTVENIYRTDVHDIILKKQKALVSDLFQKLFFFLQNSEPVFVKAKKLESY